MADSYNKKIEKFAGAIIKHKKTAELCAILRRYDFLTKEKYFKGQDIGEIPFWEVDVTSRSDV